MQEGASVSGPRVGICANNLALVGSKVSADARGCEAGKGQGPGT
jgi:hypothetical protein